MKKLPTGVDTNIDSRKYGSRSIIFDAVRNDVAYFILD